MSRALLAALAGALSAACAVEPPSSSSAELGYSSGEEVQLCSEPVAQVPLDAPPYVPDTLTNLVLEGALSPDGGQVAFQQAPPGTTWSASMVLALGGPLDGKPDERTWADVTAHGNRLRVITDRTPKGERAPRGVLVFDAGRRSLDEVELVEELQIRVGARGSASLLPLGFELTAGHGGVQLGHHKPGSSLAQAPSSCPEAALVHYGPIPFGMPPINPPEIEGCAGVDCENVMLAWIHVHHNVWRANQMFEVLEAAESYHRSFMWGQPGLDENEEPIGPGDGEDRSSPEYWYGAYSGARFSAIKQALEKYWRILRTAETADGAIDIRLYCPTLIDEANACFLTDIYGHHWIKGWVNICPEGLTDAGGAFDGNALLAIRKTLQHELLHHVFVKFQSGTRALKDTFTHGHGTSCLVDVKTTKIYLEPKVRELATYVAPDGEGCWHQNKAFQAVETHALFAEAIGTMVKSGEMWWWPEPAPPTPQPPQCEGIPGCLCLEVLQEEPDGDYTSEHFCPDNEGETACVETAVNAGAIVGICTLCEEERGPGCDCDDTMQCDVGSCYGNDTHGIDGGTGKCYLDPPPAWACLADCKRLFNDEGAYCYNEHPGAFARCMDTFCPEPLAYNCAQQGLICRDGACVQECGDTGNGWVSCQDLGYPSYFQCSSQFRCEPDV